MIRSSPKNMCSVRQRPIPSAPKSRARARVRRACRRSRARAAAEPRPPSRGSSRGPSFGCGGNERRTSPRYTRPVAAVDRDQVALAQHLPVEARSSWPLRSIVELLAARRRTACPCRAQRLPRGWSSRRAPSASPRRRPSRGCLRASSRRGRGSPSPALRTLDGMSASKTTRAARRAGRRVEPRAATSSRSLRVDHRMQQLVELTRVDRGRPPPPA